MALLAIQYFQQGWQQIGTVAVSLLEFQSGGIPALGLFFVLL